MFTRRAVDVTFSSEDAHRIPDLAMEGAAILLDLANRGVIDEAASRMKIRRQGGYCGVDIWIFLVLFLAGGPVLGVRRFWEVVQGRVHKLAALAGRRSLPSPAALSRALDAVELDLLREQSQWLLHGISDVDAVLKHPCVKSFDARGDGWHVFDLDPTVTTLRHRGLPHGGDLPEPMRTSQETGLPGHAGRKRGDIQHRRVTVQHAGSGVWVHAHLSAGNGDGVDDIKLALASVAATTDRLGAARACAIVRMDGEYGNVPSYAACRELGLPFVTRLNRPALYDDADILLRLRTATWHIVPDSLSGPRRSATDIGVLTIKPDPRTRRPDGTPYEPVTVRVVASRYPREGKANRGRIIDGWQVELFAVDLDGEAWPAPEAVAQFFGRAAQENRFGQEDRELGLDRIVSYHLPGQELVALVGLSIWNLRIAAGFQRERPPVCAPTQARRAPQVDQRAHAGWPRDPVIRQLLTDLNWSKLLAERGDWTFDPNLGGLVCPDGRSLSLTTVLPSGGHETGLVFRRPSGGCDPCDVRDACLRAASAAASKQIVVQVPTDVAEALRARLRLIRGTAKAKTPVTIEPIGEPEGPWEIAESLFLPARARQGFRDLFRGATLHITHTVPSTRAARSGLVAPNTAGRQRRRKTWAENVARYALPDGAKVSVRISGRPALGDWLRGGSAANDQVGKAA